MRLLLNEKNFTGAYPVQVNSPEQFVPLFLAYFTPNLYDYGTRRTINGDYNSMLYAENYTEAQDLSKEKLKSLLKEQLNYPYPKEYRTPFQPCQFSVESSIDSTHGTNSLVRQLEQGFFGDTLSICNQTLNVILPGFVSSVGHTSPSIRTLTSCLMSQTTINQSSKYNNLSPLMLIVVKAKHIPKLRVSVAFPQFDFDIKLPFGDMKLLQTENTRNYTSWMNIIYQNGLISFMKAQEIGVETIPDAVMNDYLFGPLIRTKKETVFERILSNQPHVVNAY